mmetsp:Transcript_91/g.296  ORF Transcript_91/g.296 Transcript_91/m.296 type:complete len:89 (-) Transcript_91:517-783(-)
MGILLAALLQVLLLLAPPWQAPQLLARPLLAALALLLLMASQLEVQHPQQSHHSLTRQYPLLSSVYVVRSSHWILHHWPSEVGNVPSR